MHNFYILAMCRLFCLHRIIKIMSLFSKEYSSYPSFTQSQYSQYYNSSYSSSYMSANNISPSTIPTSPYSLQESSHNVSSQSTESLPGKGFKLEMYFSLLILQINLLNHNFNQGLGADPIFSDTRDLILLLRITIRKRFLFVTFVCDFFKKEENLHLVYFVIFPKTVIVVFLLKNAFLYILMYNNIFGNLTTVSVLWLNYSNGDTRLTLQSINKALVIH